MPISANGAQYGLILKRGGVAHSHQESSVSAICEHARPGTARSRASGTASTSPLQTRGGPPAGQVLSSHQGSVIANEVSEKAGEGFLHWSIKDSRW